MNTVEHDELGPFLKTAEAAKLLRRSPHTLRAWARQGQGPITPFKVGTIFLWRLKDIRDLLQAK